MCAFLFIVFGFQSRISLKRVATSGHIRCTRVRTRGRCRTRGDIRDNTGESQVPQRMYPGNTSSSPHSFGLPSMAPVQKTITVVKSLFEVILWRVN